MNEQSYVDLLTVPWEAVEPDTIPEGRTVNTYRQRENAAREKVIEWQTDFGNHNYSYGELSNWGDYFTRILDRVSCWGAN